MPLPRAGAGISPRRARYFSLLRQRKVLKRKATPSLRPLRCATGQTCDGALAGCAVELALLLRSAARTATASQITKHARSDARATPQPPRRRRSQQGGWEPNSQTATRVVAALDPASAAPSARRLRPRIGPSEAMARAAVLLPNPLCMRRGAQRAGWRVCRRTHALRELTRRSCLSEARQRAASSAAHPAREHRRLPEAKRRGRRQWGRLLLPSFLGEARKEGAPPGAHPGTRPGQRHAAGPERKPRLRQAQPERAGGELSRCLETLRPITTNLIAASAYQQSARAQFHSKPVTTPPRAPATPDCQVPAAATAALTKPPAPAAPHGTGPTPTCPASRPAPGAWAPSCAKR